MAGAPNLLDGYAVLALLCEDDTHGWAVVRAMAPDGEIGRVWSIGRALVYRNIELALDAGQAERAGTERGARGSPRTLLRATPSGRAAVDHWLSEPVHHVRDLRSALLLKLLFAQRRGLDSGPLLQAQRDALERTVLALEGNPAEEEGAPFAASMRAFRIETARAGQRFVEGELARRRTATRLRGGRAGG